MSLVCLPCSFTHVLPAILRGIAIHKDHIYAYSGSNIFRAGVGADLTQPWSGEWAEVPKLHLKDEQKIKAISVSDDGQLLAVLSDGKIWALYENVHDHMNETNPFAKKSYWNDENNAAAVAVFKVPVRSWELFRGYMACCGSAKTLPLMDIAAAAGD